MNVLTLLLALIHALEWAAVNLPALGVALAIVGGLMLWEPKDAHTGG